MVRVSPLHLSRRIIVVPVTLLALTGLCWSAGIDAEECSLIERAKQSLLTAESLEVCQKVCDSGSVDACFQLGVLANSTQDKAHARELFRKVCTAGDPRGCWNLGAMLGQGEGGNLDEVEARSLFDQSCTLGLALGCNKLALIFANGEGVPKDKARARELFRRACSIESADGCFNLGVMFAKGEGGAEDQSRARDMFDRACKGGHAESCAQLSITFPQQGAVAERSEQSLSAADQRAPLDRLNVLGVRLGMTLDEAATVLRQGVRVDAVYRFLEPAHDTSLDSSGNFDPYNAVQIFVTKGGGDVITLYYAKDNRVIGVARRLRAADLTLEALEPALIEKYGTPAVKNRHQIVWGDRGRGRCEGTGSLDEYGDLNLLEGSPGDPASSFNLQTGGSGNHIIGAAAGISVRLNATVDELALCRDLLQVSPGPGDGVVEFRLVNQAPIAEVLRQFKGREKSRAAGAADAVNL